jgi:branched-chain amino acid transport system substrate-binding protein
MRQILWEGHMKRLLITAASLMIAATVAQAEIKIGSVLSVTGPASFLGDPEKKTLEMYVAEINAQGGVNGEQIKLFIYDAPGRGRQSRRGGRRLDHRHGAFNARHL